MLLPVFYAKVYSRERTSATKSVSEEKCLRPRSNKEVFVEEVTVGTDRRASVRSGDRRTSLG
jgi:hypothetical protein